MKAKKNIMPGELKVEVNLELKYCERCGGLWLRPAGGAEIYCVNCAREMAQLPPPSYVPDRIVHRKPPRPVFDYEDFESIEPEDEGDLNASGGAA